MNQSAAFPAILFTGRFGSGKTEAAINYACALASGAAPGREGEGQSATIEGGVVLVDLDIVTPYFRSREKAARMEEEGVQVIAPSVIGQHLDTPAIRPEILGAVEQTNHAVVLDVGGDKQGARALGQFSHALRQRGYIMHFVVNPFRPFTNSLEGVTGAIGEIEESARLQVTSLVSNPNLIAETTAAQILRGHALIESFAGELGLPIAFVCLERRWAARLSREDFGRPVLILDRYFVQPWEQDTDPRPLGPPKMENRGAGHEGDQ